MYARLVSLVTLPDKRESLCKAIECDISPLVEKQPGLVGHVTLISELEPRLVNVVSLWQSKSDLAYYHATVFPMVLRYLQPLLAMEPAITEFHCLSNLRSHQLPFTGKLS